MTVQVDASQRGLGTCLLQEGQPIAFASKSLTDTETRYTNIERELLAIVFACQRFNTYVLGRPFTVESDHKPLEMIHQKSLASAPPRLQHMLLQLQGYDGTIRYRPGKEMLLADALSRCLSQASGKIKLDMRVDYIAFSKTWITKPDIVDYTRRCQECIHQSQPPKEPLQAHNVPQEPWERIAMDYFYMNGRLYILICDYFSKFPFLFQTKTMSFANLKDHLVELFSVEGTPMRS